MERKKRGYKRLVEKKRDYRLFAIACEGSVRERDYFECFEVLSSRISVDLIADVDEDGNVVVSHNSSPDHVLQRAQVYANNTDLIDGDQMWIVVDVDRWPEEQLSILAQECYSRGWNLAISNPCFEVWLCYHMEEDIPDGGEIKDSVDKIIGKWEDVKDKTVEMIASASKGELFKSIFESSSIVSVYSV